MTCLSLFLPSPQLRTCENDDPLGPLCKHPVTVLSSAILVWSGRKDARLLPGYRPLSWSENMPGQVTVSTPLYYPSLGSSPQPSMWQPQATPTSRPGGEGEEAMFQLQQDLGGARDCLFLSL